jgi:cobalt-zinc-cadmium efflux system outer membrane protein
MNRARRTCLFVLAVTLASSSAYAQGLTVEQAVALALQRNRDVVAAKLDIEGSQLDVVAARIYPNPTFEYSVGNLVLGKANDTTNAIGSQPGFAGQLVQSISISEVIDVWAKRSARTRAATRGVDHQRLVTEDALRDIVHAVRSAFADVVREQSERDLAHEVADRYAQTLRLSQARYGAGDISEAELRKIELEGLRYQNDVVEADMELDLARQKLAALLGFSSPSELGMGLLLQSDTRPTFDAKALIAQAMERRPDLRAARAARVQAEAALGAAERESYPDISLGAGYTHSDFTVSGDNPNTLALSLSMPLPLFDRNQANVGRARLDIRRADNDIERLRIQIGHEVVEAVRKAQRSQTLLDVFEGTPADNRERSSGMVAKAETALHVAEKSYQAGAISLLEFLEAQRTYLDSKAQYLRVLYDFRQAAVDVTYAAGE